ncbi:MAG: hypothetical protein JXB04_00940 [Kiritimatiellae bacterium]|nr:hypothetical protein [Kiritimatiellia bacterium]
MLVRTVLALLVALIAVVPRIGYVCASAEAPVYSDMRDYLRTAVNFAEGRGIVTDDQYRAYRAPGYPVVLGLCLKGPAPTVHALRLVQAVLGAGSCALLFCLAHLLGRELAPASARRAHILLLAYVLPCVAGILMAFYDSHIFFTGVLMTETLFVFLLLAWLIVLVLLYRSSPPGLVVVAGALLGVLCLVRPGSVFYLPVLLLVIWCSATRAKQRFARLAVAAAATAAIILPWAVRNAVALKAFVPLSTSGGVNFYVGHNEHFGYNSAEKQAIRDATDMNEVEESRYFLGLGLAFVREHFAQDLRNNVAKLRHVYTTEYKPYPWTYGREFSSAFPTMGWSYPLFVAALVGLVICSRRSRAFGMTIGGVAIMHTATCMVFFGRTRFRVPLEPLFVLSAVLGVALLAMMMEHALRTRRFTAAPGRGRGSQR